MSKVAARSTPLVTQVTAPDMGRTEGDATEGSLDIVALAERTDGESSLALMSGGSHSPRGTSPYSGGQIHRTLDDAAESMERESVDEEIAAVLKALDHARGALREVIIPTSQVFTRPCLSPSFFFMYFCGLTIIFFQSLIARSREKSWFLREQKEN